jgi:hypothetical protein
MGFSRGRGRRGIKAGRLSGHTKHVCILILLCRKKPTHRLLLFLSLLRRSKGIRRRVLQVVAWPRGPEGLGGGPGVGRRIYSGFGASLGERDMFRGS